MKITPAKLCSSAASLALVAWMMSASAQAMPPTGRHATGAVREINRAAQTLTITNAAEPQPQVFRWVKRTRFIAGGSFTTAAAVPRGATVAYIYHTPLIGDPFVTKVTVLHPSPAPGRSPAQRLSSHASRP
jgi:hypothetical protein